MNEFVIVSDSTVDFTKRIFTGKTSSDHLTVLYYGRSYI